jgi:site-specific DNA-cytosine methylase
MAFPDSLEAPCRTLSSHTVEGTKRETIVLPFVDSEGRSVALPPDHVSGSGRPMTERQLERYRRRWRERGLEARGGMLFMDSRGEVVEIPWTPYQDVYPPLRPDAPSRTLYSHVAKWSRDMLVAVPFMDSKGEVVGLPWTEFQSKHPPLRPDEPSVAVVSHSAKSSRHLLAPALAEHVTTPLDPSRWWVGNEWGSRVMREGAPAFTITEKHRSGQLLPVVYRRLTVRECLRVQSFPDWWRFPEGCAVSRRYKLVGEAVPPILAYRLGVALAKALGLRAREPPREGDWALPYFRRAFADYFSG